MFRQVIQAIYPFTDSEADYFHSLFIVKKYRRNEVLLAEGEVAHELFFIQTGLLRQYFVNEDGVERTCNLSMENEFLTDLESFSKQCKATTSIVALEPTVCLVSSCVEIGAALRESKAIADFFRNMVEIVAQEEIRRTKKMLAYSPDRRFEELAESRPELLQRVSQRYIAQYLGIAPESLSRIRKRMLEQLKS